MKKTNQHQSMLLLSPFGERPGVRFVFLLLFVFESLGSLAQESDSVSHWSIGASVNPGRLIVMEKYQKKYQKERNTTAFSIELDYTPQPSDNNPFADDYKYPTFGFGVRLNRNNITMHRSAGDGWGMAEEVDYDSQLGNIVSAYSTFMRPVLVWPKHATPGQRRFEVDYTLGLGLAYAKHKYSSGNNVDNELIGSRFLIYFVGGTHATWHVSPSWAVFGGIEYSHHSNGALNRPNKGANYWGPVAGVRYTPTHGKTENGSIRTSDKSFNPYWFANMAIGFGGKTLNEDWQLTQFRTPPDSARYRTGRFHLYAAYSMQTHVMYRYARRWASGIGIDAFYGTYADRVREIEESHALTTPETQVAKVSPWSLGVAIKHHVYYGNLSARMSLGYHLYRHMGTNAKEVEKPYYEQIGLHYSFPKWGGLTIGASIQAHRTKADLTEIIVSYPLCLTK